MLCSCLPDKVDYFQSLQQVPFSELCYLALRQDRVFDVIRVYRVCF